MTPEQAAALRKPFPKSAVGVLPKPYKKDSPKSQCRECGGYHGMPAVHLDYVGHAATTDRLLAVDPSWTWEPVAVGPDGLPAFTTGVSRGLWIKLTVCGVTRLGFGDGNSVKECIGDAIRNAAMRFGVALDLWSKEELEQARGSALQSSGAEAAPDASSVEPSTSSAPEPPITDRTRKALFALMGECGISNDDDQRAFLTDTLGREVASRATLTEDEGVRAGRRLRAIQQGDPMAEWTPSFDAEEVPDA